MVSREITIKLYFVTNIFIYMAVDDCDFAMTIAVSEKTQSITLIVIIKLCRARHFLPTVSI